MQGNFAVHKTPGSFKSSTKELGDPRIIIKCID